MPPKKKEVKPVEVIEEVVEVQPEVKKKEGIKWQAKRSTTKRSRNKNAKATTKILNNQLILIEKIGFIGFFFIINI